MPFSFAVLKMACLALSETPGHALIAVPLQKKDNVLGVSSCRHKADCVPGPAAGHGFPEFALHEADQQIDTN